MNEYSIKISLYNSQFYHNLESFLVYYDNTNDVNKCFIYSIMFNIPSICEYFLSNGAYFNEKDNYGQTALHYALECNRKEISEVLISHGANIKDKDIDGKTAILIAAEYYSLETLEFPKIE